MRQQEDFRTHADARDAAQAAPVAPLFDERSARRAAPVVPLERVARRSRFANWTAGNWRATVNSPQFRRSWPLALLLVATLVAAAAATNIYTHDDNAAQPAAPAAATAETAGDTAQTANAVRADAREEIDDRREARNARRGREEAAVPDEKSVVNPDAFTAAALGGFLGNGTNDADGGRGETVAPDRDDDRGRGRDKGKRQKRSKRRHGGGAILFEVIR